MADNEKVVKIWIRISGASEDEAVGVKVPNKDEMTIGELKEAMLPLVSFDDFPITVENVEARHLEVTCEGDVLLDNDMVFKWVDETLVVAPTKDACMVRDVRPSLAVLWEDLPSSLTDSSPTNCISTPPLATPPDPDPEPEPEPVVLKKIVKKPTTRQPSLSTQSVTRRTAHLQTPSYVKAEELTAIPHVSQLIFTKSLDDIRKTDWNLQCAGLTLIRRFTVFHPHYLVNSLQSVLMAVTACMKSLRSAVMKNALLTFSDIVKSDCRELKALDAQLEPLTTEVLRLASGDNHFIRDAAEECFHDVIQHITDHHRVRLISRMLASATNSKNGTLKAQCIKVITQTVEVIEFHVLKHYSKMGLLVKSLGSFLSDASENTRAHARKLAESLADKMGGVEILAPILVANLSETQLESVGKAMGDAWAEIQPTTTPARTPPHSPAHTASRSPSNRVHRSPLKAQSPQSTSKPAKLSPSHVIPNGGCSAPTSPATTFMGKTPPAALDDAIPDADHVATPALSELNVSRGKVVKCNGFKAAWGTPQLCEFCKLKRSAHAGDWDSTSASSLNSRGSKHKWTTRRQASRTPDFNRSTPRSSPSLSHTLPAKRTSLGHGPTGKPPLIKPGSLSPTGRAAGDEQKSLREVVEAQVRAEYAEKLAEKEAMIFSLLKDNMRLKGELEKAQQEIGKQVVDHVTILTTPEFGAEFVDPNSVSSSTIDTPLPERARRSVSPENS
eukprot:TRINITY_DN4629_c0_g1_i1.p1 TRINITY_DN4629_c0_g1~~TRINITY_DN4629_c0_g1_i1.p1  ORF type:complete len:728 (+),score=141.50 TRINITY_DN4629_c0_g1_i1:44-2227(+)